jgi:acetyltransferase-like isoleucine patch superfamily enzyme
MLNKIRNTIIKHLVHYYGVLKKRFENELSHNILKEFASVGNNITIPYPFHIINPKYIIVGDNVNSMYGLRLEAIDKYANELYSPRISIGNNVSFNTDCHIGCINSIIIEDGVLIASRVFITDHFHGDTSDKYINIPPAIRPLVSKGPVLLKKNSWIGDGVVILPGVTIGENTIIGANSVVTRSIPDNVVAAGIPCKVLSKISMSDDN